MKYIILVFLFSLTFSQAYPYQGPEDPAGDPSAIREANMDGNRVFLYFKNTTELSKWQPGAQGEFSHWPTGPDAQNMLDGFAFMIGAKVYIENDHNPATRDTIPEDNLANVLSNPDDYHSLYYLQTSYREEVDHNDWNTVEWTFHPVHGYFNANNPSPGKSDNPDSWPPEGWPSEGGAMQCPEEWFGRNGCDDIRADLETYFVVNDAQDQEYLSLADSVNYYPRPGRYIGDIQPNDAQNGYPWGGLGLRVAVRGYQWQDEIAQDILIWDYEVSNISDYDLPQMTIGYWVDNGIGADSDDDIGYYNDQMDLVYCWDYDGIGLGGAIPGNMGFALLETPGIIGDGIDNDNDGIIDEQKNNPATELVGPTDGITDIDAFLAYYNLDISDLHEHWDADEDQDWDDGLDLNDNGVYEPDLGEWAGDDIGLDGIGPSDVNYSGPDEGECNHMPDYSEGIGCEPDFAQLDPSESDLIGLSTLHLFRVDNHSNSNTTRWPKNDQVMWDLLASDDFNIFTEMPTNLICLIGSGIFSLNSNMTERVALAELHSYDGLLGYDFDPNSIPELLQQKAIAQKIYSDGLKLVTGCTNPEALNFNPDANFDNGSCLFPLLGDINLSGTVDVLDMVIMVDFIMGSIIPDAYQYWAADWNADGAINVLDVVTGVAFIMNQ